MTTIEMELKVKDRKWNFGALKLEELLRRGFQVISEDENVSITIDHTAPDWDIYYEYDDEKEIAKKIDITILDVYITVKSINISGTHSLRAMMELWLEELAHDECIEIEIKQPLKVFNELGEAC